MSLHVCILGIDGSGKSTVSDALPDALAGFAGLRVASAGGRFRVADPEQTLLAPGFHPLGLPVSARLATVFRKLARASRRRLRIYPVLKIMQLAFQDGAARRLEKRYHPDVVVSEGNLVLSVAGRAANYLRPARLGFDPEPSNGTPESLGRVFAALDGTGRVDGWPGFLARLGRVLERCGLRAFRLPDVVILLDLPPETALDRIRVRGAAIDPHENARDLAQARFMYTRALDAMATCRGKTNLNSVPVGGRTPGQVLDTVTRLVAQHVNASGRPDAHGSTLGRVEGKKASWWSFLRPGYVVRCLGGRFFSGAWREPLFPLCRMGRRFLKEGYSGTVMQDIYDQDIRRPSPVERPFLGYPLHRAVYDRLHLLVPRITREMCARKGKIRILSAPCGLAEDVFRSVAHARARAGRDVDVTFTALDLDPNGRIGEHLAEKGRTAGVDVRFSRGDITRESTWSREQAGTYDIVVFVGLSSWLPKPALVAHLKRVRTLLKDDGVLVTDTFTAGAYALSGHYAGYRAHYYEPSVYASLLEVAGFAASSDEFESGRDGLNHVAVCPVRRSPARRSRITQGVRNLDLARGRIHGPTGPPDRASAERLLHRITPGESGWLCRTVGEMLGVPLVIHG